METDYFHYYTVNLVVLSISLNLLPSAILSIILLMSATLMSAADYCLHSLSAASVEKIENDSSTSAKLLQSWLKNEERLVITAVLYKLWVLVLVFLWLSSDLYQLFQISNHWMVFLLTGIVLFSIFLIFMEVIPRIICKVDEEYLRVAALPVRFLELLLFPVTLVIENLSGRVNGKSHNGKHHISIEDISNALEYTSDDPLNDEDNILQGIVNFGNIDVQKILKPRIDVIAVEKDVSAADLYDLVIECGYSRIPVYTETFDNVNGILYVKDLLPYFKDLESIDWNTLIRPAYFVPETKKVKELLKDFQAQKIHMAVVVDEYGGTTGIVTLEDIIEEIVGEIADESDEDEQFFTRIDDHTFLFEGITLLDDFYKVTQMDDTIFEEVRGDADTLAGLILEIKGEIPENGDEVDFPPFSFVVEQVENRRIKQVRVIISNIESSEEES